MFQRIFARSNLAAAALLAFLLVPDPAAAQQGQNLYEWSGGWGRSSGGSSGSYGGLEYAAPSYYTIPNFSPSGPLAGYQPFYQPGIAQEYGYYGTSGAGEASADNRSVLMSVSMPANAEIWFDGAKTKQTGPSREFVSPPLAPDSSYTYHLRVRWTEDGRTIERTRRVPVQAGDRIRLDFTDGRSAQPYDYGAFPLGDQY